MAIPSKVTGAGNGNAVQNVFRVTFSQTLSTLPDLEAWDDSTFSTTGKEMFSGTPVNGNIPYVAAVATTDLVPAANWKPAAPVGGGTASGTANRMKGLTNFIFLSAAIPTVGQSVRFNLNWEMPSDATVPATNTQNGVLAVRYAYSGATPTLTWAFNDASAGGTEGAPVWTTITPGSAGNFIRPADSSATSANPVLTKPVSGTLDSPTVWVTST